MFERSNFVAGDRVEWTLVSGPNRLATFVEYGPANMACPDNHISWPGMRIAYVDSDKFGRMPVWENALVAA
jgi:hypothetical protein